MSIALAIKRPPAQFGGAEMKLDGSTLLGFRPAEAYEINDLRRA